MTHRTPVKKSSHPTQTPVRKRSKRTIGILAGTLVVLTILTLKQTQKQTLPVDPSSISPTINPAANYLPVGAGVLLDVAPGAIPDHGTLYVVKHKDTQAYGIYNTNPDKQRYVDDHGVTHVDAKMGALTLDGEGEKPLVFFDRIVEYKKIALPGIPNAVTVTAVDVNRAQTTMKTTIVHLGTSTSDPDRTWHLEINLKKGTIKTL